MKGTHCLLAIVLLSMRSGLVLAQNTQEVVFAEARDLEISDLRGHASLTVEPSSVKVGQEFSVEIRFFNNAQWGHFYNPFLVGSLMPARLAIYDADKKYVGDLLANTGGLRMWIPVWVQIPSNCSISVTRKFAAGYVPPPLRPKLPAGKYYLQVIYFKSFVSRSPLDHGVTDPPTDDAALLQEFSKNFDRSELFRSNIVEIRFKK